MIKVDGELAAAPAAAQHGFARKTWPAFETRRDETSNGLSFYACLRFDGPTAYFFRVAIINAAVILIISLVLLALGNSTIKARHSDVILGGRDVSLV